MTKLERLAERSADRKNSSNYIKWDDRPENKKRADTERRREMKRRGASLLDILLSYKPNPARLQRIKNLRKRLAPEAESEETAAS